MDRIRGWITLVLLAGAGCALAGDGTVNRAALFADQGRLFLYPTEPNAGDPVVVRLRSATGDLTEAVVMVRAGASTQTFPMALVRTGAFDLWEGAFVLGGQTVDYWFRVRDGSDTAYLNAFEVSSAQPTRLNFWLVPGFHPPAWAAGAAWYQIFPDRFADGDPSNNVVTGEYDYYGPVQARAWGTLPNPDTASREFFGGDLEGVSASLPSYLQDLGIDAVYLNPVFRSPSSHKYDTMDYRAVDVHFGGDDALAALSAEAHSDEDFPGDYPVRIMLDGVFNHCGDWHYWFDRAHQWPTDGAYESKSSPWYGFFNFSSWPNNYVTFGVSFGGHFDSMPKLNYADAALRAEIYDDPAAIARAWLQPPYSVDGWRLDVGQEVGLNGTTEWDGSNTVGTGNHTIWAAFRQAVKGDQPDALILGEFFGYPTRWLMGDQWDSVMNYNGFAAPLSLWLLQKNLDGTTGSVTSSGLQDWLQGTLADNPWPVRQVMLNSLSTHDVTRVWYRAGGDLAAARAAAAFQMTYPGAPCVYYGDEAALDGGSDPDNRRCFPWGTLEDVPQAEMHALYRELIWLRRERSCLRTGSYTGLLADDATGTFAFARFDGTGLVATVTRRKGTAAAAVTLPMVRTGLADGAILRDVLTGDAFTVLGGQLNLGSVPGEGFRVLALERESAAWTPFSVEPERQLVLTLGSADDQLHAGWARLTFDDPAMADLLRVAESFRFDGFGPATTETILFPATPATRVQLFVNQSADGLSSGVALTNAGTQAAVVSLRLTTQAGQVYTAALNLAAGQSFPRFLPALFPDLPAEVSGVMEVSADQPVAAMQLAVRTNSRGEFLLSGLPVMVLEGAQTGTGEVILNYFAVGGGYASELHLTGAGNTAPITGEIGFFDESGNPLMVVIGKR